MGGKGGGVIGAKECYLRKNVNYNHKDLSLFDILKCLLWIKNNTSVNFKIKRKSTKSTFAFVL